MMSRRLTVIDGGQPATLDPNYWRHPVHQRRVTQRDVLEAHFATEGEPPRYALHCANQLVEAVKRNDREDPDAQSYLEMLGLFFSKPADDSCNPHGMERLFPVDPDGVA